MRADPVGRAAISATSNDVMSPWRSPGTWPGSAASRSVVPNWVRLP